MTERAKNMDKIIKISPMPISHGVGFTTFQSVDSQHRHEEIGRYHNYHVNSKSWKWPQPIQNSEPKKIDGFSPNVNKTLHVGHLRNLAIARALQGLYPNSKFVGMLGYSLGEKEGASDALKKWFDFVGYKPELYKDVDLKGPDDELVNGDGQYEGGKVWNGPKGPVLMQRSAVHPEKPNQKTYAYHDLAFNKEINPTHILTGMEQKGHFEELGIGQKHLSMGLVLDPKTGQKMKSRDGTALSAEEALQAVSDRLSETLEPKKLAWNILAYNFLKVGREKDVKFNVDEWTKPDSPGLYITYAAARILTALKKNGWDGQLKEPYELNDEDAKIVGFAEYYHYYMMVATKGMDPSAIANFTFELAKKLTKVYYGERIVGGRKGFVSSVIYAYGIMVHCMRILGMFILETV